MNNLRTIDLPTAEVYGGQYTVVPTRIKHLANNFVYSIDTQAEFIESIQSWKVKAVLKITEKNENGESVISSYSGTGVEKIGSSDINEFSACENAETSAIGRACAAAGIGLTESFASYEEVKQSKDMAVESQVKKRVSSAKTAEEKTLDKLKAK